MCVEFNFYSIYKHFEPNAINKEVIHRSFILYKLLIKND